jgi:hypothetical protein
MSKWCSIPVININRPGGVINYQERRPKEELVSVN